MDESIKLRSLVQAKARNDARKQFVKGAGRDSHGMNPGSAAIADFQAEYDRLEREYHTSANQVLAAAMVMGACPP
jgi:hypothetical protein